MCPNRFREKDTVASWVGEKLLGTTNPLAVGEVGFLTSESVSDLAAPDDLTEEDGDDVGRIDSVLMHPNLDNFAWCAVELQAVYFSGPGMTSEFKQAEAHAGDGVPFPTAIRRPDYRSSGPKRLMPQLQIKVPTLRRWGKKMAVVVDEAFFSALGRMDDVPEPSNADIAWFIVKFEERGETAELQCTVQPNCRAAFAVEISSCDRRALIFPGEYIGRRSNVILPGVFPEIFQIDGPI